MTGLKGNLKRTGYQDIDQIFAETERVLSKGQQLQQDIEKAYKFKPVYPGFKRKKPRYRLLSQ
ncbi:MULTISPECIES: hypothetical protein [Pseudobacillus]|uniref:hypothetical protein n=1 Tax=Pseudobacillus TaxID=108525 RepID=UPI0038794C1B